MGIPEILDQSGISDKNSANYEAKHRTASGEELKARHDSTYNLVGVGRYKSRTDRESEIDEHVGTRHVAFTKHKKGWSKEVVIHAKYQSYKEPFIDMLSQLQSLSDGHVGRINISKHHIDLL